MTNVRLRRFGDNDNDLRPQDGKNTGMITEEGGGVRMYHVWSKEGLKDLSPPIRPFI